MVIEKMGRDELSAADTFHFDTVFNHFVDILHGKDGMGSMIHRLGAALIGC